MYSIYKKSIMKNLTYKITALIAAVLLLAGCNLVNCKAPKIAENKPAQLQGTTAADEADTSKNASHLTARATSEKNKKAIVYQILLPVFTQEGTLDAARKMLPHIKDCGANVVYLCPVVMIDDDNDRAFWSKRQRASNTGNPKNPYRLKDYFAIEPDYGTDADLKNFVADAHKLGLRVILDLVYYHCGPKATMIAEDKNLVVCDENGNVKNGKWGFPELNFNNPKLREKMWRNMEYFVEKFDIDGYRTDVEGSVPKDFWAEGYKRISKIKGDLFMLAESRRADSQVDAYDATYGFVWQRELAKVFSGKADADALKAKWESDLNKYAKGSRLLRDIDNHDTASDICMNANARYEKLFGHRGMDAVFVINYTIDGIPMIFSGNEIADDSYFSMFSSPKHGRYFVGWQNALTDSGKRRMDLLKKLSQMKSQYRALYDGQTKWQQCSAAKDVLCFTRECRGEKIAVVVNTKNKPVSADIKLDTMGAKTLLEYAAKLDGNGQNTTAHLQAYGYVVVKLK